MALGPGIKAVGFDMDGTFMRTKVDYVRLSECTVEEFVSRGMPREMFSGTHYKLDLDEGYRWLADHGLDASKEEIKKAIADRATEIEIEHADIAKPFPGAPELVDRIHSLGLKTGILTRGGRRYMTTILGAYGLMERFDGLVARDDYDEETEAKPAAIAMIHLGEAMGGIEPESILYLGDGIIDYMTAVRAGSPFIGVTSGRTDARQWRIQVEDFLEKEPHDGCSADNLMLLDTVADLERYLRRLRICDCTYCRYERVKSLERLRRPMQVSTKARYAVRILTDMAAYQGHGNVKIKDIATRQNISVKYIEQIVVTLNKLGIVKGERGPNGGYTINGDPSRISAGDIVRLIDGSSCPAPCHPVNGAACPNLNTCPTEEIWRRIGESADAIMDEYTLADLARRQVRIVTPSDGYYI